MRRNDDQAHNGLGVVLERMGQGAEARAALCARHQAEPGER